MQHLKFVLPALAALLATPVHAQRFDDSVSIKVEAYFAGVGSHARIGTASGSIGTDIHFENQLGLADNQLLPAFEIGWRINDDWVLQGQYYGLSRRAEATLDRDLTVGETVYPVTVRLGAGFDSDVYRFTINNLVFQRKRLELGLGVGLHATDFNIFFEGQGSVGNAETSLRREQRRIFAPLPTIGAIGQWEPAERVTLFGRVDWLSLTIDEYSGRLINAEASASYRLHRHIDLGVSYRFVDYELRVRKPNWNGEVDYQFSGPALFLRAGF